MWIDGLSRVPTITQPVHPYVPNQLWVTVAFSGRHNGNIMFMSIIYLFIVTYFRIMNIYQVLSSYREERRGGEDNTLCRYVDP